MMILVKEEMPIIIKTTMLYKLLCHIDLKKKSSIWPAKNAKITYDGQNKSISLMGPNLGTIISR
jgi:hypothetical protein